MARDGVEAKQLGPAEENRATPDPVGIPPRREFSRTTKRLAWERCGGRCEGWISDIVDVLAQKRQPGRCNAPIDIGRFAYDHVDPDWYSKNNELENCQVLCVACHA